MASGISNRYSAREIDSAHQSLFIECEHILSDTTTFSTEHLAFLGRRLIQDETRVIKYASVILSRLAYSKNKSDRINLLELFKEAASAIVKKPKSAEQQRYLRATIREFRNQATGLADMGTGFKLIRPSVELAEACGIVFALDRQINPPRQRRKQRRPKRKKSGPAPQ